MVMGAVPAFADSFEELLRRAQSGNAQAQFELGLMYDEGEIVDQNSSEAVKWYRKAAQQEHAGAQFYLGVAYMEGWGVRRDYSEAARWYRKAAQQGLPEAQDALRQLGETW